MGKRVTPPKRVTSPTWGPPPPCKQALSRTGLFGGPGWHIATKKNTQKQYPPPPRRIPWQKKIAFRYSDAGDTLENKLNDLKPLYSLKKSFAFQKKLKKMLSPWRVDCSQSHIFSWDRLDISRLTVTGILIFKCTNVADVGDYLDTHARWQPVTQSAQSRWSYGKIEDCEQSTWRVNLADQNKQQPQEIKMLTTYHTWPLSMKQTFDRHMSILFD